MGITQGKKKKRWPKVLIIILSILLVLVIAATIFVGAFGYFGPLKGLNIMRIEMKYKDRPEGEIIFYGASNFALWTSIEEDLSPFIMQNRGFGGSNDNDLMDNAAKLLYPCNPKIVVFQSGSNDFLALNRSADEVNTNKDKMYSEFRKNLPKTTFVVLSMLPLPNRSELWEESQLVNQYLKEYCSTHENMIFVDATKEMLTSTGDFRPDYFSDGVHLNAVGREVWGKLIKEALASINTVS